MVLDIICNYKKCRKSMQKIAWVTICSHVFCEEHGDEHFAKNMQATLVCPACDTHLSEKFDVVQADLKPSETFKSIILAGMKPDIIMDVAMRAMSFWSYQMEEETKYQQSISKHSQEKFEQFEEQQNLNLQQVKAEMLSRKRKIEELQQDFNKQKRISEEFEANLEEKNRKIQKLQFELDSLKRHSVQINKVDEMERSHRQSIHNIVGNRYIPTSPSSVLSNSPKFVFKPQIGRQNQVDRPQNDGPSFKKKSSFVFNPVMDS